MSKTEKAYFYITILFILVAGMWLGRATFPKESPRPYQVTDKDEFGGRCYVQTWIEVTPEDYIGLEVGDEFEVKE